MKLPTRQLVHRRFMHFGLVTLTLTIALVGMIAFRALHSYDNSEVANTSNQNSSKTSKAPATKIAPVDNLADIDTATAQLNDSELDALNAQLDAEFNF
ncbi:MAG TPA: hypothetical protein VF597_02270 [Candidatus Saccharimonadales bacterium]|jgi:predicted lipid-binding transport protein (Tim44 family)